MQFEEKEKMAVLKQRAVLSASIFFVLILSVAGLINFKASYDLRKLSTDNIEAQLISISASALELVDVRQLESYNSISDVNADREAFDAVQNELRSYARSVNANYIYVIKRIDREYYYVYDTRHMADNAFEKCDLVKAHKNAFMGIASCGMLTSEDENLSYNTGAVPIYNRDGRVIAILCTDIADTFVAASTRSVYLYSAILIVVLLVVMGGMMYAVLRLLKKITKMRKTLERLANYDGITGLPNRQYLLDYLAFITSQEEATPFALFFIDLDNFKTVNDTAGHDAGDQLLRHIAEFFENVEVSAKAFRPAPGTLNIAARIGGDEFIQIFSNIQTEEEARNAAQKLFADFHEQNFDRYISKYNVGFSIGIALYPYHTENYHVLIKYADIAMYHAKRAGKNCAMIYNDEMEQKEEK